MTSGFPSTGLAAPSLDTTLLSLSNRNSPLTGGGAGQDARKAAEEFEAFFVSQMLNHMFSGIETDPLFGGGQGETVFRSLMADEYAKAISRSGGIGLADSVMGEIIRLQEGQ